jgi:hypothetical protein
MLVADKLFGNEPKPQVGPQRQAISGEIQKLRDERKSVQADLAAKRQEIHQVSAEYRTLTEKMKRVPALRRIEEIIDGKITHVVVIDHGSIAVKTADQALQARDYGRLDGMRLLTLLGNSKGDLWWGMNEYRDGSGSLTTVMPCTSEEEASESARDHASKLLQSRIINGEDYWIATTAKSCRELNVVMSVPTLAAVEAAEQRLAAKALAEAQKALDAAQAKIDALKPNTGEA